MIKYDKHIPDEELAIYVNELEDKVEDLEKTVHDIVDSFSRALQAFRWNLDRE